MSGGKGGAQVEITKYFMSIHFGVCAAADRLKRIIIKEKVAWTGEVSGLTAISISDDELFGGDKKEGGVEGLVTWLPGDDDQVLPDALAQRLGRADGTDAPGYRGICSVWFTGFGSGGVGKGVTGSGPLFDKIFGGGSGFYWSANIPYLPGVWIEIERAPKGLTPAYAMVPRPGTAYLSEVRTDFSDSIVGFSPDFQSAYMASGDVVDMTTREIIASPNAPLSGDHIAVNADGSFYVGAYSGDGVSLVQLDGTHVEAAPTTMGGGVWLVAAGIFGRHGSGQETILQLTGATVTSTSVSFHPTWYFDDLDGASWALGYPSGGIGGPVTDGIYYRDFATGTEHFVDTGEQGDVFGFVNPLGNLVVWQDDKLFLIDMATDAIVVGPVTATYPAGGGTGTPMKVMLGTQRADSSIWVGFNLYSSIDLSILRSEDRENWIVSEEINQAGVVYDRVGNALWGRNVLSGGSALIYLLGRGVDANPAHIIYEALTNPDWGMGSPTSAIDVTNFEEVGITLYNEPLGLSLIWTAQAKIESFIQEILDHIQAVLFVDPATGLLTLKLIRDDYDEATLPIITPQNAVLSNFGRKLWGDIVNEINLTWTNPDSEKDETVTVQDLASIAAQGGIVSDSRNYYGVRYADLAKRLAARDLRSAGAPLATCEAVVDRSFWTLRPASVLKAIWPEHGLDEVVMRVVGIDYGKPGDSKVKLSLMEDVFGLDAGDYVSPPTTGFEDPSEPPEAVDDALAMTLPYFAAANFTDISVAVYPEVLAGVLATSDQADASLIELWDEVTQPDSSVTWEKLANLNIVGHGLLVNDVAAEAVTTLDELDAFQGRTVPVQGGFVLIGDGAETETEIGLVTATGLTYTIARGVLDTVPRAWPAGSPVWFFDTSTLIEDPTTRSAFEDVSYKLLPRTSQGLLSLSIAPLVTATLTERPWLPSRPANVTVYGEDFNTIDTPVDATARPDPWVTVDWANRNRISEDTVVLSWTEGDVAAEDGQTTTIRVFDMALVEIAVHDSLSGTSFDVPDASFGTEALVYIAASAERTDADGTFESLQSHGIWVQVLPPAVEAAGVGTATFVSAPLSGAALSASGAGALTAVSTVVAASALSASGVGGFTASGPSAPAWSGAPGYIGSGAYTAVAGNVSLDVPYPSDVQFDDILELNVTGYEASANTPVISPPAGWTTISNGQIGGFSLHTQGTFWKRADGTESGTVTVSITNAVAADDAKTAIMSNYRGCIATGTPYEGLAATSSNSTNPIGSAVTTTGPDRTVVNLFAKTGGTGNIAEPVGWTERYDNSTTTPRTTQIALHDKTVASASTEPAEATTSTSNRWRCVTHALLPR